MGGYFIISPPLPSLPVVYKFVFEGFCTRKWKAFRCSTVEGAFDFLQFFPEGKMRCRARASRVLQSALLGL